MSAGIEISWLPSDRLADLQAFIETEWSAGHILARDAELLRWQHRLDEGRTAVVCATEDGRLKGMLGVIPVEAELRGRRAGLAWLTMWIVVPEARSSRLGLELLSFVTDRYDAVGTLGANARSQRLYRALGWQTLPAVPRWIRVLDLDSLTRLVPEAPTAAPPPFEPTAVHVSIHDWSSADIVPWNRTWDDRIAPDFVGTRRDAAYLKWRYIAHPRFVYRLRLAERAGRPVALLVHRLEVVRGTEIPVVRVVDALGEPAALAELAWDLVAIGIAERAAFADFSCTSDGSGRALRAAGFVPEDATGLRFPSRLQPLEAGPPMSFAFKAPPGVPAGDVYATRSDADMDRPN